MKSLLESRYCVPFLHTRICPEECDKTIDIFYQAFQQHAEHQNRQIQREVYHAQGVDIGFTKRMKLRDARRRFYFQERG